MLTIIYKLKSGSAHYLEDIKMVLDKNELTSKNMIDIIFLRFLRNKFIIGVLHQSLTLHGSKLILGKMFEKFKELDIKRINFACASYFSFSLKIYQVIICTPLRTLSHI